MTLQQPHLEDKVVDHGNEIEEISFYFNIINFVIISVALATVDYLLLHRLKEFYPSFYKQEKRKIIFSNLSIIVCMIFRVGMNIVMSSEFYVKDINSSYLDGTWFL